MRRGEVWWYEEPDEPPRPWVILTRDAAIDHLDKLLAAPTTRTIRHLQSEVPLDREDGTPYKCAVSFDNTTPILKAFLIEQITMLSPTKLTELCRAFNTAVDC
jgi:mRNA interferase MazF